MQNDGRALAGLTTGSLKVNVPSKENLDYNFISATTFYDHAVVDALDMSTHTGPFISNINRMKVYVFCYKFGYVLTLGDTDLAVM